jgi:predicted dehydrogenase
MLAQEKLDFVSIATPATHHAEAVLAAASAGVRVIWCEKAMAASLRDCDTMIEACARQGVLLAINTQRRWDADCRYWASLIHDGVLGELQSISISFGRGRFCRGGSHWIDLALWFARSRPATVWGRLSDPSAWDPGGWGVIELENGVLITVDARPGLTHVCEIEAIGTRGKLVLSRAGLVPQLWLGTDGDPAGWTQHPFSRNYPVRSPMLNALDNMIGSLEGRDSLLCSGEEGRAAFEAISAIHLSHRSGRRPVRVPLAARDIVIPST